MLLKKLAKNLQMSYTYDELSRVTKRVVLDLATEESTEEQFAYDAAGNITASGSTHCSYDTHNRLTAFAGNSLTYDAEGNLLKIHGTLSNTPADFAYDSSNRLISAGDLAYTYNAEDVRIRAINGTKVTTYTYDTNAQLSRLLTKTENGVTTKYVYGLGLIGEEKYYSFKTYHFDYRGSTVAITNSSGTVADRFQYDTYGKLISRTGSTDTPFLYDGRDGVMTDPNGLCYMRARYYSPVLRRFINADIVAGALSDAITLNRYAYANGNPVSNIDPFGLSAERGDQTLEVISCGYDFETKLAAFFTAATNGAELSFGKIKFIKDGSYINIKGDTATLYNFGITQRRIRIDNLHKYPNIGKYIDFNASFSDAFSPYVNIAKRSAGAVDYFGVAGDVIGIGLDTAFEVSKYDTLEDQIIAGTYTATTRIISTAASAAASAATTAGIAKLASLAGTAICPGLGTAIGFLAGFAVGLLVDYAADQIQDKYIDNIIRNN